MCGRDLCARPRPAAIAFVCLFDLEELDGGKRLDPDVELSSVASVADEGRRMEPRLFSKVTGATL